MTREEAIERLNELDNIYNQLSYEDKEAIDMAIKSLEAWEKVTEEMQEQYRTFANIPSISDVWADAIEIIDKHLSEVSE